jgi:thiol-disulfide isomerase/thioredoxin
MAKRLFVLVAFAALTGCSSGSSGYARVGAQAPAWTDPLVGGGTLSQTKLLGKPALLDFFATWCPPCNAQAPVVEAAYREYAPEGLQVVGVDIQENAKKARQFVTLHGLTYPSVVDGGTISDEYALEGMPVTVFIDKTGVIRKIEVGEITRQQLNQDVRAIL